MRCWPVMRLRFVRALRRLVRVGAPRRQLPAAVTTLALLALAACARDVTDLNHLRLVVRSEPPMQPGATISSLRLDVRSPDGAIRLPQPGQEASLSFALPVGRNIVTEPFTIDLTQPSSSAGTLQLRVVGTDKAQVLTAWSGIVDTAHAGERAITLLAPTAACDADGDGVADCTKPGCCVEGAASDCNDDPTPGKTGMAIGAAAHPFAWEDPCTQCGNGLDEDCDGSDVACTDTDQDGVPDCQETACPPGAALDPAIHPGAAETCDGKDNDCNLLVDDRQATASDPQPLHAPGEACGQGACAGGVWQCNAADAGMPMRCSTAGLAAAQEDCDNAVDDTCDGRINEGCALLDYDGDGVRNDVEAAQCAYALAMYHAEFHPAASGEACCPADVTDTTLCDRNCDGKVTPCDPSDKDGDGWPAAKDCDDSDPWTHLGAPEKCGDGKVQSCVGKDPPCDANDKDGDGWWPPADCDDANKDVHPEGVEACNGVDDNCDGVIDDGNPGGLDAACGNVQGECGHVGAQWGVASGIAVCKHYKPGQLLEDPLDCSQPLDAISGTCVGCVGDRRPQPEQCNGLDDDCSGGSDEAFAYVDETGVKLAVGAACDGTGACGLGVVECQSTALASCSSNPGGSTAQAQAETCNNLDDNCDGATDENLQAVADSTCLKAGVCGVGLAQIQSVCVAGSWRCDYGLVPGVELSAQACVPGQSGCGCTGTPPSCHLLAEQSCDGQDNDCDGKTDEDFVLVDFDGLSLRKLGEACGTGACSGGQAVCAADGDSLVCSSQGAAAAEACNLLDDDCNGKTDEASALGVGQSTCKQAGVCAAHPPLAACVSGQWLCDYAEVPGWQSPAETSCDGLDNDCDGSADEGCDQDGDGACSAGMLVVAGAGVCPAGGGDCNDQAAGIHPGATELCNAVDDDCNGQTDEGVRTTFYADTDGDGFGDPASSVLACSAPAGHVSQAGDCNDSTAAVHPGASEACNGQDDDCDGSTDEGVQTVYFTDGDADGFGLADATTLACAVPSGFASVAGDCADNDAAVHPGATEACDGLDNDCDGVTDPLAAAGCQAFLADADGDGFAGAGAPSACLCAASPAFPVQVAGDCNDADKAIFPGAAETCNGVDDGCNGATDEGNPGGGGLCATGDPGICAAGTEACVGGQLACVGLLSAATETCDGLDEDCDGVTDNGFVGAGLTPGAACGVGACAGGTWTCTPDHSAAYCTTASAATLETCDGIDNDCDGLTDAADGGLLTVPCGLQSGVCAGAVRPLALCVAGEWLDCGAAEYAALSLAWADTETCADALDNDCDGETDESCPP